MSIYRLDHPKLIGGADEQPRMLVAYAIQHPKPAAGEDRFAIAALIRHHDPEQRRAIATSNLSFPHAAKALEDGLTAKGIAWDGSYRVGAPEQFLKSMGVQTPGQAAAAGFN